VYQVSISDAPTPQNKYSNQNVMEYLRRIVPRMFQVCYTLFLVVRNCRKAKRLALSFSQNFEVDLSRYLDYLRFVDTHLFVYVWNVITNFVAGYCFHFIVWKVSVAVFFEIVRIK
jgi:hypothetical protein